jgi:hypothetical protein
MVTRTEFISKWKTHFLFCGLFLAAFAFSVVVNMFAGERFSQSVLLVVQEIRPAEVLMFFAFWYVCAFYRRNDEWSSSFTSLNLTSKDEKRLERVREKVMKSRM